MATEKRGWGVERRQNLKSVAAVFVVKVIESLTQFWRHEYDGRQNGENSIALERSKINSVGLRFLLFIAICVSIEERSLLEGVYTVRSERQVKD